MGKHRSPCPQCWSCSPRVEESASLIGSVEMQKSLRALDLGTCNVTCSESFDVSEVALDKIELGRCTCSISEKTSSDSSGCADLHRPRLREDRLGGRQAAVRGQRGGGRGAGSPGDCGRAEDAGRRRGQLPKLSVGTGGIPIRTPFRTSRRCREGQASRPGDFQAPDLRFLELTKGEPAG